MKPKLFLIDGTALLYRAYFAFIKNPLVNSKGQNTSAVYGVVNSFMAILDKMQAEHIAIAFDRKAPTFRHADYQAYKANRPPMPDDMQSQVSLVADFFIQIGVPELGKDGYEADDALGTMGEAFKDRYTIVYVTSDKDYCQLIDADAFLYDPMKDVMLDSDAVYQKYGVRADQFVDYLALVGDSSDNIPGVKGIGPKGASSLLQDHGSLEGVYRNLADISANLKTKLETDKENAFLSQHLATIVRNADLLLPPEGSLKFAGLSLQKAIPMLKELELISLVRRIEAKYGALQSQDVPQPDSFSQGDIFESEAATQSSEPVADTGFEAILVDLSSFDALLSALQRTDAIALDTETDSLDPHLASLVGISLCFDAERAYYIPLNHKLETNIPTEYCLAKLRNALSGKTIVGHNLKYDLRILERHGWQPSNDIFDTMLASYILDSGSYSHSLDTCALSELEHRMIPITDLIGKGKSQISFDLVSVSDACRYAAEDAWATYRLYLIYKERLLAHPAQKVFYEIELPLVRVLLNMESNGVCIDTSRLSEISHMLNIEMKRLRDEIYDQAGYEFNLNSTQQLGVLLFEKLKLPTKKKTKSGFSTDNSVLESLSEDYPIAKLIMDYRQLAKLESTYVAALPKLVNPISNRIHSSFNQCVASTGRLSSSNPNLQNIPVRTKIGREIRKAFIAPNSESQILSADYSQIELRLLALMSRDAVLLDAFQRDMDIHKQTAAQIFGIPVEAVNSEQRRIAKTINFGLMYGMGQRKLSRELGISLIEAKSMIANYFSQFPSIKKYIADCVDRARRTETASTLFGRTLRLPGINSKNPGISSEAERVSVNMPIQGTAADIIKIAMLDIHAKIIDNPKLKLILQVHDELVFEVAQDYLETAKKLISEAMENALPEQFRALVELKTEIGFGKSWYDAH